MYITAISCPQLGREKAILGLDLSTFILSELGVVKESRHVDKKSFADCVTCA